MGVEKSEPAKPVDDTERARDKPSKGQYGGLKSLGPGGGRDIKDADTTDVEDTDRRDVGATGNR